jgi:hypothetical protein
MAWSDSTDPLDGAPDGALVLQLVCEDSSVAGEGSVGVLALLLQLIRQQQCVHYRGGLHSTPRLVLVGQRGLGHSRHELEALREELLMLPTLANLLVCPTHKNPQDATQYSIRQGRRRDRSPCIAPP